MLTCPVRLLDLDSTQQVLLQSEQMEVSRGSWVPKLSTTHGSTTLQRQAKSLLRDLPTFAVERKGVSPLNGPEPRTQSAFQEGTIPWSVGRLYPAYRNPNQHTLVSPSSTAGRCTPLPEPHQTRGVGSRHLFSPGSAGDRSSFGAACVSCESNRRGTFPPNPCSKADNCSKLKVSFLF